MIKLFHLTFLLLFVCSIFLTSFAMPQADDLNDLKYPSQSMVHTLVKKPVDTSGLENLRYPTQSLFSTILSKILGAFGSFMVSE